MSKFMMWFKKVMLVAVLAGIGLSALPMADAFALGLNDTTTPPAGQVSNARLEKVWAAEQNRYQQAGKLFAGSDKRIADAQKLIDQAKANGKDVSAVQSALDAFVAAGKQAKTIYDGGQSLISSHAGFDSAGKVTDVAQAQATVKSVAQLFKQIQSTVDGPRKAFIDAVKAFRQANNPAGTPKPHQGGG